MEVRGTGEGEDKWFCVATERRVRGFRLVTGWLSMSKLSRLSLRGCPSSASVL